MFMFQESLIHVYKDGIDLDRAAAAEQVIATRRMANMMLVFPIMNATLSSISA